MVPRLPMFYPYPSCNQKGPILPSSGPEIGPMARYLAPVQLTEFVPGWCCVQAHAVCCESQEAARATRLLRKEHVNKWGKCVLQRERETERQRQRERALFVNLITLPQAWNGPGTFTK